MWRVAFKGLLAHKLRFALTALAVVLGVAFVAGTFVLTDTINKTFTDLFNQTTKGVDVAVRSNQSFNTQSGPQRASIPATLADRLKTEVEGVADAQGAVTGYAQYIGNNGKPVTTGGAPTLGVSAFTSTKLQAGTVREGSRPSGSDEVAVDAHTAKQQGFHVGDRVKILFQGPSRYFRISGIIGFG